MLKRKMYKIFTYNFSQLCKIVFLFSIRIGKEKILESDLIILNCIKQCISSVLIDIIKDEYNVDKSSISWKGKFLALPNYVIKFRISSLNYLSIN